MILQKSELRAFKQSTAAIKTNQVIPVLAYLLLDGNKLIKNNLEAFIIEEITVDNTEKLLIDEKTLYNFLDFTTGDTISLTHDTEKIIFAAGGKTTSHPICNEPFQLNKPDGDEIFIDFDSATISSLQIASNFIDESDIKTARDYVMVGNSMVCASNGFIAYFNMCEKLNSDLFLVLDRKVCQSLNGLLRVSFAQNDSYYFFESEKTLFGFVKPIIEYFDMRFVNKNETDKFFSANKDELIRFNNMCSSQMTSAFVSSVMEFENKLLRLSFYDSGYDMKINSEVEIDFCTEERIEKFAYNSRFLNRILSAIPDEQIFIYRQEKSILISNKTNSYTTFIQGLII
jgi:hypothetical protein